MNNASHDAPGEAKHSKMIILIFFFKDAEGYVTKKSSGRPQEVLTALSQRIGRAVREVIG